MLQVYIEFMEKGKVFRISWKIAHLQSVNREYLSSVNANNCLSVDRGQKHSCVTGDFYIITHPFL